VVFKSRLLTTAFIVPFTVSATLAPSWGFELKPDTDETDFPTYTTTVATSDDEPDGDSILIDGSPPNDNSGLLIDSDNVDVTIDGPITVRSQQDNGDASATPLTAATGVKITADNSSVRFKSGARIYIIEGISLTDLSDDLRGPDYDADGDGFADNDSDEDGISEGSQALPGNNWRVGFWKVGAVSTDIIGEAGSSIVVYGNGVGVQHAAGVVISDTQLDGYLDLSTRISVFGDETRGVDILSSITGYYRQRGDIDVRGENSVGIDIGADISGALMIEGLVNATGYSTAPTPQRGIDESGLTNAQQTANTQERRRGGSAVNVDGDIAGGIIVGGAVNRFITDDEQEEINAINERRSNDNNDDDNVVLLKTDPYHFDENRADGRITTYGEADGEASLKITGTIGAVGGSTHEALLDTRDDDDDDTAASDIDVADIYNGTGAFFYSHGLMNRGRIEANSWYDAVKKGADYQIDTKATALLLDSTATIHGGIYNSGTISATAYNSDAVAVHIDIDASLNDGLRGDDVVLLNENTIQAQIQTDTRSHDDVTKSSNSAIAIGYTDFAIGIDSGGLPVPRQFVNRGSITASSAHVREDEDTAGLYVSEAGDNAIAFDFADYTGDVNITQELLQNDLLLDASAPNANTNPYKASGDTDIDRAGDTDADNNVTGDGVIDTRDVLAPLIAGDVKFNGSNNIFTINAGTVTGDIFFGGGTDSLTLTNEIADDTADDYTAPITTFTGRITNGSGTDLDIIIGDRTQLHLVGQEGDAEMETENLAIDDLNLSGDLRFTIDADQLTADTPVLNVADLTVNAGAKIIPNLVGLSAEEETTIDLIDYVNDGGMLPADIMDLMPSAADNDLAFIYDVALSHDEDANTISANFVRKTASDLGLNPTEAAAFDAVIAHFSTSAILSNAMTALMNQEDFMAAYEQLLPHYSDGTAQQLSGLADMATGAVSQHLQIVTAGGRRGGDGWLQQFGDYRKQDSSAKGQTVSGNNYAIALGYDLPVYIIDALGLYMQLGFSAVNEKSSSLNEVKSESISYGAYLSDRIGPLEYQLNASYGFVDLESERLVNFNGIVDIANANWDATSTAASARLAYPIFKDDYLLRLEAGMDYFRLEHDDYAESEIAGSGFAFNIAGGESEKTSQFIGLRGGYRVGEGGDDVGIIFEPNYYLGWRSNGEFTPYSATAKFIGADETFRLMSYIEPKDALDFGLGFAAHNDYFAFEFNYRARIADDEETHGGGISIRLLF
jgi:uncharacterized protein with beta-barrel porin domain